MRRRTPTACLRGCGAVLGAALVLLPAPAARAAAVPTPESVLGFVPGEARRLARWGQVLEYVNALAAASPHGRKGLPTRAGPFCFRRTGARRNDNSDKVNRFETMQAFKIRKVNNF